MLHNLSVAWIGQDQVGLGSYERALNDHGASVEWFEYAISALNAFARQRYDLIVTSCSIAAGGHGDERYSEIDNICDPHDMAEYLIRRTKMGQNANTPIVVAGFCPQEKSGHFIDAGASKYFALIDVFPSEFVKALEQMDVKPNPPAPSPSP